MDYLWLIFSGIGMGLVAAVPVGPVNIICIRRTFAFGPLNGFLSGLGAALGDGVFAAITVATATRLKAGPAAALASQLEGGVYHIEHPTGSMEVFLDLDGEGNVKGAGSIRTARKLFEGRVFPAG